MAALLFPQTVEMSRKLMDRVDEALKVPLVRVVHTLGLTREQMKEARLSELFGTTSMFSLT